MTSDAHPQPQPTLAGRTGAALGRLFGLVLRLLFVLVLAVALGAGLYFGVPALYRGWVQPVQDHSAQLAALNVRLDGLNSAIEQGRQAQDTRLTQLETAGDGQRQRLGAAESALADAQAALEAETAARQALADEAAALRAELEALGASADATADELARLEPQLAEQSAAAAALSQQLALLSLQNGLLQARLQVAAENLGEARLLLADSAAAVQAYIETAEGLPADQQTALAVRTATAEALIEASPAEALAELEAVWRQLDRAAAGEGE
jgi:chromosome segregation ATPase